MKSVHVKSHGIDPKAYKYAAPSREHYDTVISDPSLVYRDGQLEVILDHLDNVGDLELAMHEIDNWIEGTRTEGLKNKSKVFGYQPRLALRRDFCTIAQLAREHPEVHELVCSYGRKLSAVYEKYGGEVYQHHAKLMEEKVKPEWRIQGTVYTSGIINNNNALAYHFDSGNFKGCWSAMIVLPSRLEGGLLVMPDFRLAVEFKRPAMFFFDGQRILHGVTKIERPKAGWRYSLVYYSLKQIWHCLPPDEEVARIQKVKTEREHRRLAYDRGEDNPDAFAKRKRK